MSVGGRACAVEGAGECPTSAVGVGPPSAVGEPSGSGGLLSAGVPTAAVVASGDAAARNSWGAAGLRIFSRPALNIALAI